MTPNSDYFSRDDHSSTRHSLTNPNHPQHESNDLGRSERYGSLDSAFDDVSADSTMPPSGTEIPVQEDGQQSSQPPRRKKHIAWMLPEDEEDDAGTLVGEPSPSSLRTESQHQGQGDDEVDMTDLERQITHEELRRDIHQIFNQHPPDLRGGKPSSPPPGESKRSKFMPRSVLRKAGDQTPEPMSSPEEIHSTLR